MTRFDSPCGRFQVKIGKDSSFGVTQPAGALATLLCFAQVGKPELYGVVGSEAF